MEAAITSLLGRVQDSPLRFAAAVIPFGLAWRAYSKYANPRSSGGGDRLHDTYLDALATEGDSGGLNLSALDGGSDPRTPPVLWSVEQITQMLATAPVGTKIRAVVEGVAVPMNPRSWYARHDSADRLKHSHGLDFHCQLFSFAIP